MKKSSNTLILMAMPLFLAGCAIKPDAAPIAQPRDIATLESSQSFHAPKAAWPASDWWHSYNDAQLDQMIAEALANAPSLAEAVARTHQAEAAAGQSESSLYPNISANGSVYKMRQSYNQGVPPEAIPKGFNDQSRATLDMAYQLDFWGHNRALVAAAATEADAARLEQEQARLILTTNVAAAYANLAHLYAQLDAMNEALDVRAESANLIKQRQDNGLENRGSFEQALAAKASTEAELAALDESIALAKNQLAALIGAGPDRALTITRPQIDKLQPFGLPDNLPAELLGRRPDIIAARLRATADQKKIDAAETKFYPNVNLVGYIGHQSLGLDYFTSPHSLIANLGPTVSLPLFDGGALANAYRQSEAVYENAIATYNATLLQALHEVANAVTSEKMLAPRLQKTKAAVAASTQAYDVINNRYKGGLASYLAVLKAEDDLIANKRALADIRSRAFTLDVALIRALGGGFTANTTP